MPIYDSYDGAPFIENITNGSVRYLDLTIPQYGLNVYDWVMSLEVAEHIPAQYETIYLSNLIRHANEGIVLSWAPPEQIGFEHVNPKSETYVISRMAELCFNLDKMATRRLRKSAELPWLIRNIKVFYRRSDCILNEIDA